MKASQRVYILAAILVSVSCIVVGQDIEYNLPPLSTLSPINPYRDLTFDEYIKEKTLGEISDKTWNYEPDNPLSSEDYIETLAYVLKLYKNFADANDVTLKTLNVETLKYGEWTLKEDDIARYFDVDHSLFRQSELLREYLGFR